MALFLASYVVVVIIIVVVVIVVVICVVVVIVVVICVIPFITIIPFNNHFLVIKANILNVTNIVFLIIFIGDIGIRTIPPNQKYAIPIYTHYTHTFKLK